jgi:hypothetical protein
MTESHNGTPVGGRPGTGGSDYMDGRLRLLKEELQSRGLDCSLNTYPVNGVKGKHFDKVLVNNPAAPERGDIHIEKEGLVTWEIFVNLHDDADVSQILDDVANILLGGMIR